MARALARTRDRFARGRPRARTREGRAVSRAVAGCDRFQVLGDDCKTYAFFCHGAGAPLKFVIWEIKLRSQNELKLLKVKSHSENVISDPAYLNQLPTPLLPATSPSPFPALPPVFLGEGRGRRGRMVVAGGKEGGWESCGEGGGEGEGASAPARAATSPNY